MSSPPTTTTTNKTNRQEKRLRWPLVLIALCLLALATLALPVNADEAESIEARYTLYLFTPVQMCEIRYCVTADLIAARVDTAVGEQVTVVEVPVVAFHMYDVGAPPGFIHADWEMASDSAWMPDPVRTVFGWGIAAPQMVLVDEHDQLVLDFDGSLEMDKLVTALKRKPTAPPF